MNTINYLSSVGVLEEDLALGLEQEDILRRINDTAFKDLEDHRGSPHDMKMFSYLDQK